MAKTGVACDVLLSCCVRIHIEFQVRSNHAAVNLQRHHKANDAANVYQDHRCHRSPHGFTHRQRPSKPKACLAIYHRTEKPTCQYKDNCTQESGPRLPMPKRPQTASPPCCSSLYRPKSPQFWKRLVSPVNVHGVQVLHNDCRQVLRAPGSGPTERRKPESPARNC